MAQVPHVTRFARRLAWAAAVLSLVAVAGCTSRARTTGKEPQGDVRPLKEGLDEQAGRDPARPFSPDSAPRGTNVPEDQRVEGVIGKATYHRPDCKLLEDVPVASRVPFTSVWDGLDAGHGPCRVCDPGP